MYRNMQEFVEGYGWESAVTAKLFANLTPESLSQQKAPGHDVTLGELAYHIATAPAMMMREVKWDLPERGWTSGGNVNLEELQANYASDVAAIQKLASEASEEQLNTVHHVFGMMDWNSHQMLGALVCHEIHHRGQLSVLMRQAGLVVPSIYGPNFEETQEMLKQMQQG
ncbi:DinB family protein [bacterium]|nr:DinB family protein [bacterium]